MLYREVMFLEEKQKSMPGSSADGSIQTETVISTRSPSAMSEAEKRRLLRDRLHRILNLVYGCIEA